MVPGRLFFRLRYWLKFHRYAKKYRPFCLNCRKPIMEFGKLCDDCADDPTLMLPDVGTVPEGRL